MAGKIDVSSAVQGFFPLGGASGRTPDWWALAVMSGPALRSAKGPGLLFDELDAMRKSVGPMKLHRSFGGHALCRADEDVYDLRIPLALPDGWRVELVKGPPFHLVEVGDKTTRGAVVYVIDRDTRTLYGRRNRRISLANVDKHLLRAPDGSLHRKIPEVAL